jgi:hypothetical protein
MARSQGGRLVPARRRAGNGNRRDLASPIDRPTYDAVSERCRPAARDAGLRSHAAGEVDGTWHVAHHRGLGLPATASHVHANPLYPTIDDVSGGPRAGRGVRGAQYPRLVDLLDAERRVLASNPEVKVYALSGAR